ncbi:transglycosylase [Mycolicibacterium sp. CH28]|uniref:transglycosylase domain-containing protein n=1 Tax=Mycolicibacterium sp. CH28 TaxID=2512237 RepID=UPI00107FFB54|nr:transglycosylase domain-containing protein [Mycolicibacterium sp. CH28]TGD85341.1 transglycosylase [Mycolicibacterium sp. CH28]
MTAHYDLTDSIPSDNHGCDESFASLDNYVNTADSIFKRFRRVSLRATFIALIINMLTVVLFHWYTPPTTAFMLEQSSRPQYQFVSIDHVSRLFLAAVVVHEDQYLGPRVGGFDWGVMIRRAQHFLATSEDHGGSTIPQQLVKNIFLWPGQNPFRKIAEAVLAEEFAYTNSDKRMLELYINYAQLGPGIFGICAATWYYFNEAPWNMDAEQSAQLVALLPMPDLFRRAPGGGIAFGPDAGPNTIDNFNGAANYWVPKELEELDGWQSVVASVGITDTAGDHRDERANPDSCSSMPAAVARRLRVEDPWFMAAYGT